jgi:hypothetical protein
MPAPRSPPPVRVRKRAAIGSDGEDRVRVGCGELASCEEFGTALDHGMREILELHFARHAWRL